MDKTLATWCLACVLVGACCAPAHAAHAGHPYGHHGASVLATTPTGAALRTVPTAAVQWAARPVPYALGTYATRPPAPHGHSTLRQQHVQALAHCNPFAGVRATAPLPLCR